MILLTCIDCLLPVIEPKQAGTNGNQRIRCLPCTKIKKAKNYQDWAAKNKEHLANYNFIKSRTAKRRFRGLLTSAKKRNLEVTITINQMEQINCLPCDYCQGYFDTDDHAGCHLDRKDNSLGYTENNCVSCCSFCNALKMDVLSYNEAKLLIQTLIIFRQSENKSK